MDAAVHADVWQEEVDAARIQLYFAPRLGRYTCSTECVRNTAEGEWDLWNRKQSRQMLDNKAHTLLLGRSLHRKL